MNGLLRSMSGWSFLAGVGVFAYQLYFWLQHGEWRSLSIVEVIVLLDSKNPNVDHWNWIYFPDSWLGLHKILNQFPIALLLIIGGFVFLWCAALQGSAKTDKLDEP